MSSQSAQAEEHCPGGTLPLQSPAWPAYCNTRVQAPFTDTSLFPAVVPRNILCNRHGPFVAASRQFAWETSMLKISRRSFAISQRPPQHSQAKLKPGGSVPSLSWKFGVSQRRKSCRTSQVHADLLADAQWLRKNRGKLRTENGLTRQQGCWRGQLFFGSKRVTL